MSDLPYLIQHGPNLSKTVFQEFEFLFLRNEWGSIPPTNLILFSTFDHVAGIRCLFDIHLFDLNLQDHWILFKWISFGIRLEGQYSILLLFIIQFWCKFCTVFGCHVDKINAKSVRFLFFHWIWSLRKRECLWKYPILSQSCFYLLHFGRTSVVIC